MHLTITGKSTFLKALAGQLTIGSAHLDGEILYNGDSIDSGKYLVGKLAAYAEEKEQHAATLTVRETLEFAWKITTGGHHSYGVAKDEKSAENLDREDKHLIKVRFLHFSFHASRSNVSHRHSYSCPTGEQPFKGPRTL